MVKIKPAFSYFLIIPILPTAPSPSNEQNNDEENIRGGCASSCQCLWEYFAALIVVTLLIAAVVIPIMVIHFTAEGSTTSTAISSTTAITTTDIPCSPSCNSEQRCVKGVCVGIGYISCTLTWSRPGDGDIVLTTPNYNTIHYSNMGPSASTDEGQLDVDNTVGTGPENIFWSNSSSIPPTGVYYVCFSQFSFNPTASIANPIIATITVMRLSNVELTVTKTFTSVIKNYTICGSTSANLLTSFTYS